MTIFRHFTHCKQIAMVLFDHGRGKILNLIMVNDASGRPEPIMPA